MTQGGPGTSDDCQTPAAMPAGRGVRTPGRLRLAMSATAMTGLMMSAVIWGKLRLVGSVPRTAYAEPGLVEQDPEHDDQMSETPASGAKALPEASPEQVDASSALPGDERVGRVSGNDR